MKMFLVLLALVFAVYFMAIGLACSGKPRSPQEEDLF